MGVSLSDTLQELALIRSLELIGGVLVATDAASLGRVSMLVLSLQTTQLCEALFEIV